MPMVFGRNLLTHTVIIRDKTSRQEIRRQTVKSPVEMSGVQLGEHEQSEFVTSWWGQLVNFCQSIDVFKSPMQRVQASRSSAWDNDLHLRVGDIIGRPYIVQTDVRQELHVYDGYFELFKVGKKGRVQVPLLELKSCLNAIVISDLPNDEVIARIKEQPFELH